MPNKNISITEAELKELIQGIDDKYINQLENCRSVEHGRLIRDRILAQIDGKSENRILLEEILKAAKVTKRQCSELLWDHQHSLDGYLYRFNGEVFPSSFAYFFLNSIHYYTSLKSKSRPHNIKFYKTLAFAKEIGAEKKLIIPALEHHMIMLSRSYINFSLDDYDPGYINAVVPGAEEYISDPVQAEDPENQKIGGAAEELTSKTETEKFSQSQKMIDSIRKFKPALEFFRNKYMKKFIPPDQIADVEVNDKEIGTFFTKKFLRKEFDVADRDKIVLHKVQDNLMAPTLNKNDFVLIQEYPKVFEPHLNTFKDGLYAIKRDIDYLNSEIQIRKITFGSTCFIYSDFEKIQSAEKVEYLDLIKGKKIHDNKDDDINMIEEIDKVFSKDKKIKLFEIDYLINKYRGSVYLQRKIKQNPVTKKLFGDEGLDAMFEEAGQMKFKLYGKVLWSMSNHIKNQVDIHSLEPKKSIFENLEDIYEQKEIKKIA